MGKINSINVNTLFIHIAKHNEVQEVQDNVQELKPEYITDGWEDEFDSINEVYIEQGRGEAENAVLGDLIKKNTIHLPAEVYNKLYGMLALHYDLEVD